MLEGTMAAKKLEMSLLNQNSDRKRPCMLGEETHQAHRPPCPYRGRQGADWTVLNEHLSPSPGERDPK